MRRTATNPENSSRIVIQKLRIVSTKREDIQNSRKELTVQKHKTLSRDHHKTDAVDHKTPRRSVGATVSNGSRPATKTRRTISPHIIQNHSRRHDPIGKKDGAKRFLAPEQTFEIGLSCRLEKEQTKMRRRTNLCSINRLVTAQNDSSEVVGKIMLLMKVYKPVSNSIDKFRPEILKAKHAESIPKSLCRLPVLQESDKHLPESGRFPKRKHRIAPLENFEQNGARRPSEVIPEKFPESDSKALDDASSNLEIVTTIDPLQKSSLKSYERRKQSKNDIDIEFQSTIHSKLQRHRSETCLMLRKPRDIKGKTFGSDHQFPSTLRSIPKEVRDVKSAEENELMLINREAENKQVSNLGADEKLPVIATPFSTALNDNPVERECSSPSRECFTGQSDKLPPLTKSSLTSTKSLPLNLAVSEAFNRGKPSLVTSGILSLGLFWLPVNGQLISGHNLTAEDKYRQETLGNLS